MTSFLYLNIYKNLEMLSYVVARVLSHYHKTDIVLFIYKFFNFLKFFFKKWLAIIRVINR